MKNRFDRFADKVRIRSNQNRLRELRTISRDQDSSSPFVFANGDKLLNFCSNDYLGLGNHHHIKKRACEYVEKYGSGALSSRLISGNLTCHDELEQALATFFDEEASLVFNTGFQANISVISAIAGANTVILIDKLSHNSLLQGAWLSKAEVVRFAHNDAHHLQMLLEKHQSAENLLIITESLFSMDGDRAPLDDICALAEQFNALLLVDDAHAVGVFGEQGKGLTYGRDRIDIKTGTFGKSFGSLGGYVLCSNLMRSYFINFCAGFIYTTGIQPATAGSVLEGLRMIPAMDSERILISQNACFLRDSLNALGFETLASDSQIVPAVMGSDEKALAVSDYLNNNGVLVSAIRPPTVQDGAARLRFSITALHKREHIEKVVTLLKQFKLEEKIGNG